MGGVTESLLLFLIPLRLARTLLAAALLVLRFVSYGPLGAVPFVLATDRKSVV